MLEGDVGMGPSPANNAVHEQQGPASNSEIVPVDENPETQRALKYKCRQLQKRVRYLGSKLGSMR